MLRKAFFSAVLCCLLASPGRGQQQEQRPDTRPGGLGAEFGSIRVNARNATGAPLSVPAVVQLRQRVGSILLTETAGPGEGAVFRNLPAGDYTIEVTAEGFKAASEDTTLRSGAGDVQVFVHLVPISIPAATPATAPPVLAPKVAKEVQEAIFALSSGDLDGAQKRLQRAEKAAPTHPEVQYLLGMLDVRRSDGAGARRRFEKAIALYPQHVGALSALGRLLFQQGDLAGAASSLERALVVDGRSPDSHNLLATVFLELQQLEKARYHAQQALDISANRRPDTRLLLAQIFAAQGDRQQAAATLEKFLADYPAHPGAQKARKMMADWRGNSGACPGGSTAQSEADRSSPPASASAAPNQPRSSAGPAPKGALPFAASTTEPDATGPLAREWAPTDVDEVPPAVFREVQCSDAQVIERVGQRVVDLANNLGDVDAAEEVMHTVIDSKGYLGRSETRKYEYMFAIRRWRERLWVEEMRNGTFGGAFGTDTISDTATSGLVAMALIFHPHFAADFEVRCEGQGNWQGEPVWFLYFRQRADRPGRFYRHRNHRGATVWVPLKGRAWVAANSYQILRIEIGMVAPIPDEQLERIQFIIEYKPVEFQGRKGRFWLPSVAETFMHVRGKRWHRRHSLSNYIHFAVDTKQKIAGPKVPDEPPEEPAKKPPLFLH